jgi:opacity protein-like surface antigen
MKTAFTLALSLLAGTAAWAADPDAEALSLPGTTQQIGEPPRAWQLFVEGAAGRSLSRNAWLVDEAYSTQRLSLDLQVDASLGAGLRALFADRLDANWQYGFERRKVVNTLKDAYLSWQPRSDYIVDLGRVNQYSGVGIGYNPTDFFRDGALRSQVSVDPTLIKKDRQGSVMLRVQALWEDTSLMALFSPKLSEHPGTGSFDLDWGSTNHNNRGLLIFSKRLSEDLNPQWLLYQEQGALPQLGMNVTKLVNDSTVAYLEWAGGRGPSLLAQAFGHTSDRSFRNRVAAGLTFSTSNKISLTAEYQYNGAGLEKMQWDALPLTSQQAYVLYRQFAHSAQDMTTRRSTFYYATWQDMLISHLDLTAMVRRNSDDRSHLSWVELRYRWSRDEIAVQWLGNSGKLLTDYGALPLRNAWQVSYRIFF